MSLPFRLGEAVEQNAWTQIKLRMMFDHFKWDIQSEDHCVLCDFPLLLDANEWRQLGAMAEALTNEVLAAEAELLHRPDLHWKLGIPRKIRRVLAQTKRHGATAARVMRFDFHFTDEGWRISEVNADVPGGFIEAGGFTRLMAAHCDHAIAPPDPADVYVDKLFEKCGAGATFAMLHATAYQDDRQVMQYLAKLITARGGRAIIVSPSHLEWSEGTARVSTSFAAAEIQGIVRFFPAEWLSIIRPDSRIRNFFGQSLTPIANPGCALLVQSKRFPLVWDELKTNLPTWRALLPETREVSSVSRADRENWVLKPAFGRVGEGIGIAGITPKSELTKTRLAARLFPRQWVAQRRFYPVPAENKLGKFYPSLGVYTVNGQAAGVYARICHRPLIDDEAQDIAVLISDGEIK